MWKKPQHSVENAVLEHILPAQLTPWRSSAWDARDSPVTYDPKDAELSHT